VGSPIGIKIVSTEYDNRIGMSRRLIHHPGFRSKSHDGVPRKVENGAQRNKKYQ
jgi:hypothetical protein